MRRRRMAFVQCSVLFPRGMIEGVPDGPPAREAPAINVEATEYEPIVWS